MKKIVSIIIPCYNVEMVISRCLDSVFEQKLSVVDIEVICIDDKSTDRTLDVLKSYEQKFSDRMIVIALPENGKQGRARNVGLEYSTGDFVMYVDADDLVADSIVEELFIALQDNQCDVAECGFKSFSDQCDRQVITEGEPEVYDLSITEMRKNFMLRHLHKVAPWGRIYRKEVLKNDEDVFFPEGITMEDIYFSQTLATKLNKYVYIPKILYFYYINQNGTSYSLEAVNYYMDSMIVQDAVTDLVLSKGLIRGCEMELEYIHFWYAFVTILFRMIQNKYFFSYYNYCWAYREINMRYPNITENPYVSKNESALVQFACESCKRQFTEMELAIAMYGDHYREVLNRPNADKTRVSVIIVAKNQKESLCKTLGSLLQQTWDNLEIIIVDDASTDESLKTVQDLFGDSEKIVYICNERGLGKGASYNVGIEKATGTVLSFANCGATWNRDRLMIQMNALESHDDWNYCTVKNGQKIVPMQGYWSEIRKENQVAELIRDNQISIEGIIVKKTCCNAVDGFDENLLVLQDRDFMIRLAKYSSGRYVDDVLVEGNQSLSPADQYTISSIYLLIKFSQDLKDLGIKEEKFVHVMDNARLLGQFHVLWDYIEWLLDDEEYASFWEKYVQSHNLVRKIEQCEGDTISGIKHCIGCMVCFEKCPVGAIRIEQDMLGFSVPVVDDKQCIHCGKCVAFCPTQSDIRGEFRPCVCHAIRAKEVFRLRGSSGGMFPLLAEQFVKRGGYVAGAVFDSNNTVKHIVSNKWNDVVKMFGSKYVQSNIREVYSLVEELLKRNKQVLFSGVSCQIVSLKTYLKKDYDNLFTIDVVCHGVPSSSAWKYYLNRINPEQKEIEAISFRDKEQLGWRTGLYIRFTDGTEKKYYENEYIKAFLNNWILRESCYHCNFKAETYSDITLGDFWGIKNIDPEFGNDGTSFVTINSKKGELLYNKCQFFLEKDKLFPTEFAISNNPSVERPVHENVMHKQIATICHRGDWEWAINQIYKNLQFDIAMFCLWSRNYGNALTNYALYQVLSRFGNTIIVDTGVTKPEDRFEEFAHKYYLRTSDYYGQNEWDNLQDNTRVFLVGSDQVWNSEYMYGSRWGTFFQLGFIADNKKKISYASSFGQRGFEPEGEEFVKLYSSFQHISVRESFGVQVCREKYGKDAVQVLDPVFLLDKQDYERLLCDMPVNKSQFIFAYLLTPTKEKQRICKEIQKEFSGIPIIYVVDNNIYTRTYYRELLNYENVKIDASVEEWLYYLRNAEYIITDSFHGTCFSIIFRKQFLSFVNRQTDRFRLFDRFPGVSERIMAVDKVQQERLTFEEIDYSLAEEVLEKEKKRSLEWLEQALRE